MEIIQMLSQAGIVALLSMIVSVFPLVAGLAYAIKPTERRLAMMRPISLAGLFGALGGFVVGLINVLQGVWSAEAAIDWRVMSVGAAESLVTLFVAFKSLTVGWLFVAIGFWRQSSSASEPV